MRFFKLLLIPIVLCLSGCQSDEEQKFHLMFDVLKAVDCVPWPVEGESCLCFGEIKLRGIFAFLAPANVCDEPAGIDNALTGASELELTL